MADDSQNQQARQSSISRARRIPDEEWEGFRPTIEKLYQEQGYSRNALIEKLSKDGFPVTEKQLKHILKKWGTKKKVCSTDMQNMLAVKRKRDEDGKMTMFKYHGHVMDEAKLLRAEKRFKIPISSHAALPSYIEAFSPNLTNRSPLPSQSVVENSRIGTLSLSLAHLSPTWHEFIDESYISTAAQQRITLGPNEADLGASFLQNEALPLNFSRSVTSMVNNDFDLPSSMEPLSNNTNPLFNISRASDMPLLANSPNRPVFCPRLPSPVPNSVITSPLATLLDLDTPAGLSDGYQTSLRLDLEPMSLSNEVIFYGTNPESIIPAIQLMRKLFDHLQDDTFRNQHIESRGMSTWELDHEIRSEVLLSKIDEISLWAYQASAKKVQQQRAARQSSCMDIEPFSQIHDKNHEQMSHVQARSMSNESNSTRLGGTLISYCDVGTICTTGGSLRIQLHRTPKEVSDSDEDDSLITVTISAIPEIRNRAEAGVYITIPPIPRSSQGLPICNIIRTFNVVPENSEIIECVRTNDLDGVRRLIGEKKASPWDVDPRGISLLWYAMFSGCSETFRLLLEGGASTHQCQMFTNPCNLIDSIWGHYIETAIDQEVVYLGSPTMGFTDIGQCRSMTELALAKGCLAEESVPYNPTMPTPLFFLGGTGRTEITRCRIADGLKQLLWAGYGKEVQNNTGQTPLLHFTFSLETRSLTIVELLLAEDAIIHAVDSKGRGTLHLCLSFSEALEKHFFRVCRRSTSAHSDRLAAEYLTATNVSGERGFDLQYNERNVDEVLPSDDGDGQIDEESDVDSVDCDSEDLSNDTDDSLQPHGCYWCGEMDWCIETIWVEDRGMTERDKEDLFYCEDRDIDDFNMPETLDSEPQRWKCKAQVRHKLLALLKAGCCPNILDSEGLSPSHYATAEGLWPQWEWALSNSGFQYNEHTDSWERES